MQVDFHPEHFFVRYIKITQFPRFLQKLKLLFKVVNIVNVEVHDPHEVGQRRLGQCQFERRKLHFELVRLIEFLRVNQPVVRCVVNLLKIYI